jgi:DNA-binding response OmpR family regulator
VKRGESKPIRSRQAYCLHIRPEAGLRYSILALSEDNIATTFLLATRLREVGHEIEVVSDAGAFIARLRADRFDWLLVDGDVARVAGKGLFDSLTARRGVARIVWIGQRPRQSTIAIAARFAKPISYAELCRYFSALATSDKKRLQGRARTRVPRERSST